MEDCVQLCSRIDGIVPEITDRSFAIYPCGIIGEFTKNYLKEKYQLSASFFIDNTKASNNNAEYITTEKLSEIECNELIFLIASNSKRYYKEIRAEIRRYVSNDNIIDLFPKVPQKNTNSIYRALWEKMLYPHSLTSFLRKIKNAYTTRVLDVGCGNRSPEKVKAILDKIYYVGIDVGDYNQSENSIGYANEYHIVKSEDFAAQIEKFGNSFDAIISRHNIKHCDEAERVLIAMITALKKGGKLYMAFPSEESAHFPKGRNGCLNFFDDCTHQKVPDWKVINSILDKQGMKIIYKTRNYRPYVLRKIGELNEAKSRELKTVLEGTWEYYGFESVIWSKKR